MTAEKDRPLESHLAQAGPWGALFLFCVATLWVFDFIFDGYRITNNAYLYAHEPWAHYMNPSVGFYNYMLSDDMDVMSCTFPVVEQIRRGDFPFWNRFWQLGANGFRLDTGWFYPFRWLWIAFGIENGMTAEVLIRHTLSGFFTFLLLQRLGVSWVVSMSSGLGYAFGSVAIGDYMYGFGPIGLALPFMVYLVEQLIQKRRARDLVFVSCGWIFINTHMMVHVNALACLWIALYAFLRILSEKSKYEDLGRLSISIISSVLILAVLLLPTLDFYLSYFNSSYRTEYSTQQLHPATLLTLLYNSFFGVPLLEKERYLFGSFTGSGIFIGFATMLGIIGLALPRLLVLRDKYLIPPLAISLVLVFLVYELPLEHAENLFGYFPILKATPPYYQRPILQFFLMIIGALGLDFFVRGAYSVRIHRLCLTVILSLAGLSIALFLIYYFWVGPSALSWSYFKVTTFVHLLLVAALFVHRQARNYWRPGAPRHLGVIISASVILIATIYEGRIGGKQWFPRSKSGNWNPRTDTTDFLQTALRPGERVLSLDQFAVPGLLFSYGMPVAAGRSMPQAEYLELLRLAAPNLHRDHPTQSFFDSRTTDLLSPVWDLVSVNFFLASVDIPPEYFEKKFGHAFIVHAFRDGTVLERRNRVKPFRFTNHVKTVASVTDMISLLRTQDLEDTILTDTPNFTLSASRSGCAVASEVTNYRQTSSALEFSFLSQASDKDCPNFLMFSMAHDKGWRAYIDGKSTEMFTAFGVFPFIKLPSSGVHHVKLVFYPRFIEIGTVLSFSGLLLLVLSTRKLSRSVPKSTD